MSTFKKTALSLAVSSSILLSACGGGGGGSDSSPQTPPSTSLAGVVEGSAIKGLLKDAAVRAYELDNSGNRARMVGQGTSDQQGRYSLELSSEYQGGAIEIEVASAGSTKMLCDAVEGCGNTAFGQEIAVPAGFKMLALIPEASKSAGAKVEAAVTPWSHMAAERAKKLIAEGESAQAAARKASSETSEIVGFDISATKAADLSVLGTDASAAEVKYAAANAALASVLLADPAKVQEKLDQLAKSFDDGKFDDSDEVKIGEIKQGLKKVVESDQFTKVGNEEAANDLKNVEAKLPETGDYNPEPVDDDLLTGADVEKFKAFTKQARTWFSAIENTDFDTPLEALAIDVETVQQALGDDTVGVTQLLGETLGQVLDHLNSNSTEVQEALNTEGSLTVSIQDSESQPLGDIKVDFATVNGVALTLSGTIGGTQETLTITGLTLATNVPASAFAEGVFASFESSQVEMRLSGKASTSLVTIDLNELAVNVATSQRLSYSGSMTETAFEEAFKSASLTGNMEIVHAQGSRFNGTVGVELVRLGSVQHPYSTASLKKFEVTGAFQGSKGSFDAAIALNVSNAAQFDTFGFLDHSDRREVHVQLPVEEALPELVAPTDSLNVVETMYSVFSDRETDNLRISRQYWSGNGYINRYTQISAASTPDQFEANVQAMLANAADFEGNTPFVGKESGFSLKSVGFNGYDSVVVTMTAPATDLVEGWYSESDLNEDGKPDFVWLNNYDNSVQIELTGGELYAAQVLNELSVSIPQDSVLRNFFYEVPSSDYSYSSVNFDVPASQETYESCIANPDAVLPELLGDGLYGRVSGFDSGYKQYLCANHTLADASYESVVISAEETAVIKAKLVQAVQNKHPNVSVEELDDIWSYDFFSSDTQVDWEVDVQFGRFERDDYFLQGSLTLSAGLQLPELPKATVTATLNRTKLNGGDLSAAVQWDGGSYNVALSVDDVDAEVVPAKAVISNTAGHRLVLSTADAAADELKLTGEAFVGSNKVGNVETTDKGLYVIRYTDGTFETLY